MNVVKDLHDLCIKNNITLSVAESCTSGRLASMLTSLSGSSNYFRGGIIAYQNIVKIKNLNISSNLINQFTEVSHQVVKEMAKNSCLKFDTDFSVSTSGYAGPTGGTKLNPLGTIYIGVAAKKKIVSKKFLLKGIRQNLIEEASIIALQFLYKEIKKSNKL